MEPDDRGYASPPGWHNLFPEDSFDAVIAMCRLRSERGYLCGLIAAGDPDGATCDELARFDAGAAELVASVPAPRATWQETTPDGRPSHQLTSAAGGWTRSARCAPTSTSRCCRAKRVSPSW